MKRLTISDPERMVTMWSRTSGIHGHTLSNIMTGSMDDLRPWVIERSYPLRYLIEALDMPANEGEGRLVGRGREIAWFEKDVNPNTDKWWRS